MLYSFLKIFIGTARRIFCRRIFINQPELLREKGPLILACNHPNSFLDAVILDLLFDKPIWSLARGDAFMSKTINTILIKLKMLPPSKNSAATFAKGGDRKEYVGGVCVPSPYLY